MSRHGRRAGPGGRRVTRHGQGTLEYVLIFAVIAIVVMVAAYFLRNQIRNAANQAMAQLDTWIKDPSKLPKRPGDLTGGGPKGAEAKADAGTAEAKGQGAASADAKGAKAGIDVEKPAGPAEATEEPGFSLSRIPVARQVLLVGGAVGVVLGIFLFLRQAKR